MSAVTRASEARFRSWRAALPACAASVLLLIAAARSSPAQQSNAVELDAIVSLLKADAGAALADVGAGSGFWAVEMARRVGPRGLVYATEVKPALARQIQSSADREKLDNVTVIVAQHDDPKLPDQCCDALLLRFVYHALREPERVLKGLHLALKPGGRVLIIDFGPSVPELAAQMREFGFELDKVTEPWLGREQVYGALFVRAEAF